MAGLAHGTNGCPSAKALGYDQGKEENAERPRPNAQSRMETAGVAARRKALTPSAALISTKTFRRAKGVRAVNLGNSDDQSDD
jgi:hypothetical protein